MAFISPLGGAGLLAPVRSGSLLAGSLRSFSLVRQRQDLLRLDETLRSLRRQLDSVQSRGPGLRKESELAAARALSSSPLDLRKTETAAQISSSDEVNTIATSFTPFGPTISGSSTSLATIGGVYDGAQGDDTLTFQIRDSRTVGEDRRLRVRVRDGAGQTIANLNFRNVAPGTALSLPNGLTLALGAGDVRSGDTFQVQVSTSTGSRVDPTKPFDGTRNDNPNFELGLSVTAGGFDVNGVRIAVAADDTLNAVLARITASATGVTATFDTATEQVVLTQKTPGPESSIVLENDTSGFLAATKLEGASVVAGTRIDPLGDPIASVPALSSIRAGDIQVNGVSLTIDPAADSVRDVVSRINASGAGVIASLDESSGLLSIVARDEEDTVVLSDGTSGFFSALGVAEGSYRPRTLQAEAGEAAVRPLREDLRELGRTIAGLFRQSFAPGAAGEISVLRGSLTAAVTDTFTSFFDDAQGERLRSGFGIDFDFRTSATEILSLDLERLERAAARDLGGLADFLFADREGETGLVPAVIDVIADFQERLDEQLGRVEPAGRLVDLLS